MRKKTDQGILPKVIMDAIKSDEVQTIFDNPEEDQSGLSGWQEHSKKIAKEKKNLTK